MKDRDKLDPLLRAYKNQLVDIDYAIDYRMNTVVSNKRYYSFMLGVITRGILSIG